MEIRVTEEGEVMAEQKKAVALARVRLLEQQMQMALQVRDERWMIFSVSTTSRHEPEQRCSYSVVEYQLQKPAYDGMEVGHLRCQRHHEYKHQTPGINIDWTT